MGDRCRWCCVQGRDEQGECRHIGVESVFVPKVLEAGLGTAAVPHHEARDDLVDQERIPAIEEEVELSWLAGSLHGRRAARRVIGAAVLWLAVGVLPAEADERGALMRQPMTIHDAAGAATRESGMSLDTAENGARAQDRSPRRPRLINACAGKTTPGYWIERLDDRDPDTRILAARALGEMRDPTAVPALVRALKDPSQHIVKAAVQALGRIGPAASPAAPALNEMLAAEDGALREEARRSLESIGATRHGTPRSP